MYTNKYFLYYIINMETTLNQYMTKVNSIITTCQDLNTTQAILQPLLTSLATIDTQIDTEILTMAMPTSMTHLNLFILVQNFRCSKKELHKNLLELVKLRLSQSGDYPTFLTYSENTYILKNYVESVINSCSCMGSTKYIVSSYI
jgi:hypothetical protein